MEGFGMEQPTSNWSGICVKGFTAIASSQGLLLGDNPLRASLPLLLAQLTVIIATSHALHSFLRHLGQPRIVSQMITGILLGPSCLGSLVVFEEVMFAESSWFQLNMIVVIGLVLYQFLVGLKTDVHTILSTRNQALVIALAGRITPVIVLNTIRLLWWDELPEKITKEGTFQGISSTWSVSSFVVVTSLLNELNLLNSKVGRLAIATSLVDSLLDVTMHTLSSIFKNGFYGEGAKTEISSEEGYIAQWVLVVLTYMALVVFIVGIARAVAKNIAKRTPEGEQITEPDFVVVMVLALVCGLVSEVMGYRFSYGMLLVGLAMPSGAPMGYTVSERVEAVVMGLCMPVLMAKPGLLSNVAKLMADIKTWLYVLLFLLLMVAVKVAAVAVMALWFRLPAGMALTLALMLTSKGFTEVENSLIWWDRSFFAVEDISIYTLCTVMVIATTTPLIKLLYKPSTQYGNNELRTVQHAQPRDELCIMVCLHVQEDVDPLLAIVHAINPTPSTPLSLCAVHLIQLVGRAVTIFLPYCKHRDRFVSGGSLTETDIVFNALKNFVNKQLYGDCVLLQPFVSISPDATVHDDLCTLAVDKKVVLVIIPYHKEEITGNKKFMFQKTQSINMNMLRYAPCSVAIFIDSARLKCPLRVIQVLFFGGADDREALALALRMTESPYVCVTIFRFLHANEEQRDHISVDVRFDKVVLEAARHHPKVVYREETAKDSEGVMEAIKSKMVEQSLVIVGRREGLECPLTKELSMWSETPELGGVGDLLVSNSFAVKVSTLVVQQQIQRL